MQNENYEIIVTILVFLYSLGGIGWICDLPIILVVTRHFCILEIRVPWHIRSTGIIFLSYKDIDRDLEGDGVTSFSPLKKYYNHCMLLWIKEQIQSFESHWNQKEYNFSPEWITKSEFISQLLTQNRKEDGGHSWPCYRSARTYHFHYSSIVREKNSENTFLPKRMFLYFWYVIDLIF